VTRVVKSEPAFSSVVVGALMFEMDDAQTTLVIPSLIRSDMNPPQGMKKAPGDGADRTGAFVR